MKKKENASVYQAYKRAKIRDIFQISCTLIKLLRSENFHEAADFIIIALMSVEEKL